MALSDEQKDMLQEIVGITERGEMDTRASWLNAAQEATIAEDITLWETVRDKHLKVKGGRDGVDLDNSRKRAAITSRCRLRLQMEDTGNFVRVIRS